MREILPEAQKKFEPTVVFFAIPGGTAAFGVLDIVIVGADLVSTHNFVFRVVLFTFKVTSVPLPKLVDKYKQATHMLFHGFKCTPL